MVAVGRAAHPRYADGDMIDAEGVKDGSRGSRSAPKVRGRRYDRRRRCQKMVAVGRAAHPRYTDGDATDAEGVKDGSRGSRSAPTVHGRRCDRRRRCRRTSSPTVRVVLRRQSIALAHLTQALSATAFGVGAIKNSQPGLRCATSGYHLRRPSASVRLKTARPGVRCATPGYHLRRPSASV